MRQKQQKTSNLWTFWPIIQLHDKQTSSQRKCREHLSNQPSHRDNVTHQGIPISQPCYEDEWMDCMRRKYHLVCRKVVGGNFHSTQKCPHSDFVSSLETI